MLSIGGLQVVGCLPKRETAPNARDSVKDAVRGEGERTICAVGNTACALTADGRVACWGESYDPRSRVDTPWATVVPGLDNAVLLSCSLDRICALSRDGNVRCVEALGAQKLGAHAFRDVTRLWVGGNAVCAGESTGVRCDGDVLAQDIYGVPVDPRTPAVVDFNRLLTRATEVVPGHAHTCLVADGRLHCVKRSPAGDEPPTMVRGPTMSNLTLGPNFTCGIASKAVVCVGVAASLRKLRGEYVVTTLRDLGSADDVATGNHHVCARNAERRVRCLGSNGFGQLGVSVYPQDVNDAVGGTLDLADVREIALGLWHSCARLGNGDVYCWGDNDHGQLGDGSKKDRVTPRIVRLP